MIKAIVFDMDGVLFLSSRAHETAFEKVLREMGVKRLDYKRVAGMKTRDAIQMILRSEKIPTTSHEIEALARKKQALAYRLLVQNPPVVKGCRLLLEKLSQRYQLALVSSSRRKNVALFLKASKTRRFFSLIMGGEDLPQSKPSPLVYKTVLARLHLNAREILVVEDSPQGVRAATGAHLQVIGVQGTCSGRQLKRAGAFRIVRDIRGLESA